MFTSNVAFRAAIWRFRSRLPNVKAFLMQQPDPQQAAWIKAVSATSCQSMTPIRVQVSKHLLGYVVDRYQSAMLLIGTTQSKSPVCHTGNRHSQAT